MKDWWIYTGNGEPNDRIKFLPEPPSWRQFEEKVLIKPYFESKEDPHIRHRFGTQKDSAIFQSTPEEIDLINAALYLRRPLLVTGKPGTGKSSLAFAVAYELKLGPILRWAITTRATLNEGLYQYDAVGRLQEASLRRKDSPPDISRYLRLGPLGTALLPTSHPRVLLIDEIDKSDIDLPNDLLNIFEEGEFEIPELMRLPKTAGEQLILPYDGNDDHDRVPIKDGRVQCKAFPFVVMTSNGEREFPPAFLRRCIRLDLQPPDKQQLTRIVEAHLGMEILEQSNSLIETFLQRRKIGDLATDQLLNAIYLVSHNVDIREKSALLNAVFRYLSVTEDL